MASFKLELAISLCRLSQSKDLICKTASENNTKVYWDAEESWVQDSIDRITEDMMQKYNCEKAIVYNTAQLYRWDRLDYLKRDSFYSGVSEGVVSSDRIINMLRVHKDELVIEEKGIYSIEKFIVARRLMYWQVYLHKTVLAAENLLVKILKRAKHLAKNEEDLFASPVLKQFLYNDYTKKDFLEDSVLEAFTQLDDYDIYTSIKTWCNHSDFTLSYMSKSLINRNLPKIILQKNSLDDSKISIMEEKVKAEFDLNNEQVSDLVFYNSITNNAYNAEKDKIKIWFKNGDILDITEASDNFNIKSLTQVVKKHFICYPKSMGKF